MKPPALRLEALTEGEAPVEMITVADGLITIGREPENNIVIDDSAVSRRHACLFSAGTRWVFRDLGSSNGSWLNGLQVGPSTFKLVRNQDVIKLANFPIQLSELSAEGAVPAASLLIFFGEDFHSEIPVEAGFRYVLGGPEGNLKLDPEEGGSIGTVISGTSGALDLLVGAGARIAVNGMSVAGSTRLADRDEVQIGGYRILVADAGSAQQFSGRRWPTGDYGSNGSSHEGRHSGDEWQSEAEKRRSIANRRFVFGSPVEEDDVTGTLSMGKERFAARAGLEISPSQRFSGTGHEVITEESEVANRIMIGLGFLVFVLLIAGIVFILLL